MDKNYLEWLKVKPSGQAHQFGDEVWKAAIKFERERLAKKIEKLPFGDTAQSFAVWVREQDV